MKPPKITITLELTHEEHGILAKNIAWAEDHVRRLIVKEMSNRNPNFDLAAIWVKDGEVLSKIYSDISYQLTDNFVEEPLPPLM